MKRETLKSIFLYSLLMGIFGWLGFSSTYHIPQLKKWLLDELASYTHQHGPVAVFADELNFHLVPIGVSLEHVRLVPKSDLRRDLDPVRIEHVQAGIDPQMLFASQLGLSELTIDGVHLRARLHPQARPAQAKTVELPLRDIFNTPILRVHLSRVALEMYDVENRWSASTEDLDLVAENRRSGVIATLTPVDIRFQTEKNKVHFDEKGRLALRVQMTDDTIAIQHFRFDKGETTVSLNGHADGDVAHLKLNHSSWQTDVQIETNPLQRTLNPLLHSLNLPGADLPELNGRIESKLSLETNASRAPLLSGQVRTRELKLGAFVLGDIQTELRLNDEVISTSDLHAESKGADIHITNLKVKLGDVPTIAGTLKATRLELREFLNQIDVTDLPLHMDVNGELPCQGQLKPVQIQCDGQIQGSHFRLYNEKTNKTIVALERFGIKGGVEIKPEGVFPHAAVTVGDTSAGNVEGGVTFKEGFKFKYKTSALAFKDIKSLADLKLEGVVAVEGTTEGDGKHGLIDMKISSREFWFEDYGVGNTQADLHYKAGKLNFQNIDGLFRTSRYRGNLTLDLDDDKISGQTQIPYIELSDLQRMFERKVKLPFHSLGSGVADLKVEGPLDFAHLSYTLHSTFSNLQIDDEKLNELVFNVSSVKGEVKTDRVEARKKHNSVTLIGTAHPSGKADIKMASDGLQLDEFQTLNKAGLNLHGTLNFQMQMVGQILSPDTHMEAAVNRTFLGTEPLADSHLSLDFFRNAVSGKGDFFGKQVELDFQLPFNAETPFRWKMRAQEFDLAPLAAVLGNQSGVRDLSALLTTQVNLQAPRGGFWHSTGAIHVDSLIVQKGKLQMHSEAPLHARLQDGVIDFVPWKFRGDNTLFQIEAHQAQREHLNFALNGKIELALFSFLTPFLSDMRGTLSIAMQTLGRADDINLVGTALIEKGYVRLKEFPHPFEDIRTDAIFNKNQLIINSIQTNLAGGRAYGEGTIRFEGLRNIPLQIHGRVENVQFDVPKGLHTQGSGDFQISGDWFPFLFAANFDVQEGLYSRGFDEQETGTSALPRANLLPRFVTEQDVDALRFNLQTNLNHGIVVRNNLLDAELNGNLVVKGTTNKPILGGELAFIRGGKLFFHETPFEITAGTVKFNDARENNPTIYMTATTHVQFYDVSLVAQGPSKNLQINLQSTPPLAPREIISLLALGESPDDASRLKEFSSSQTDNTNYQAGSALLSNNPFGKEIKKRTGFDVKFSSAVDDTDRAAVPMIKVQREVTPKLNVSASHSLGQLVTEDVKVEYKLSDKLSAVGSWDDKTYTFENGTPSGKDTNYFGLDLQYRLQFK